MRAEGEVGLPVRHEELPQGVQICGGSRTHRIAPTLIASAVGDEGYILSHFVEIRAETEAHTAGCAQACVQHFLAEFLGSFTGKVRRFGWRIPGRHAMPLYAKSNLK
jgi:hypothetical protein